jgi:hypothetical protein
MAAPAKGQYALVGKTHRRTYAYADLIEFYRAYMLADKPPPMPACSCTEKHRASVRQGGHWAGRPAHEFAPILDAGVDLDPGEQAVLPVALDGEGTAWRWNDQDGDYDHAEFLSGEADYYLDRRIEPGKPGIYVHVEDWWVAGTSGETIAAYGSWVASAVAAIQSQGFDVALTVTASANDIVDGERGRSEFSVVVKRFGEQLIARDFAVLFTHEGFRHLMFTSYCMPEIFEPGKRTGHYLGTIIRGVHYSVEFDPDTRVLHISNDSSGATFPAEDMSTMLREVRGEF